MGTQMETPEMTLEDKATSIVVVAMSVASRVESWADFSLEMFDQNHGVVAGIFPDMEDRRRFYLSPAHDQVGEILKGLMTRFGVARGANLSRSGKLLIRIPRSLHDALAEEADREGVSMNQLVVAKLAVSFRYATHTAK